MKYNRCILMQKYKLLIFLDKFYTIIKENTDIELIRLLKKLIRYIYYYYPLQKQIEKYLIVYANGNKNRGYMKSNGYETTEANAGMNICV